MTLLTPTTSPIVHIEYLPETATGVYLTATNTSINIQTWAPGDDMDCDESDEDPNDWIENHCNDCEYHCEEMEHYADGEEIKGLQLTGTYYTYSPCSCYTDGLSYVDFPCEQGYDGPQPSEFETLSTEHMSYVIHLHPVDYGYVGESKAFIQSVKVVDGVLNASAQYPAVNCFTDDKICWGDNDVGSNLAEIQAIFTGSIANQDLTSYYDHYHNSESAGRAARRPWPDAIVLQDDGYTKAVVTASVKSDTTAFMLMASAGCKVSRYVAYAVVYYYPQVELAPGVVRNIWATDVLSTSTRLLFADYISDERSMNCEFLGQVPSNFNLSQCKSQQQQSSEQAVLAST